MLSFLKLSINFWIVLALNIIIMCYYLYRRITANNVEQYILQQAPVIPDDRIKFNSEIQSLCKKKDDCYIIMYIARNVQRVYNQDGIEKTVKFLSKRNNFINIESGIRTYVVKKNKNKSYTFLFHSNTDWDGQTTAAVDKKIMSQHKKCPSSAKCTTTEVVKDIWKFVGEHEHGGMFEYFWHPPGSNKKQVRRAMIRSLDHSTIVVSEMTVQITTVYINIGVAIVFMVNMLMFALTWELLGVTKLFQNPILSHTVYAIIIFGFCFNLINSMSRNIDGTLFDAIKDAEFSSTIARGAASLSVGIAVFLTLVTRVDYQESVNNILRIVCMCFIFLLLSIVEVGKKVNYQNFIIAADITNNLAYNAIVYVIICILYIYLHAKQR